MTRMRLIDAESEDPSFQSALGRELGCGSVWGLGFKVQGLGFRV